MDTAIAADSLLSAGLAALAALLPLDDQSPEAQFLRSHDLQNRFSRFQPDDSSEALSQLSSELGLSRVEMLVTALAAAVETDLMSGRAIAHLQAPLGGSRPTLGLLAAALPDLAGAGNGIAAILAGPAVGSGLLQILNEGAPLAERAVSVPAPLCLALLANGRDRDATWPGTMLSSSSICEIPLPPSIVGRASKQARGLSGTAQKALVIRSGSPAEARAVASEIAQSMGLRALFIDPEKTGRTPLPGLGPWLLLKRLLPVFCFELEPGERKSLPVLPRYSGPRLALCGPEGSIESLGESVPGWTIGVAPKDERTWLWTTALGDGPLARELAATHRHGSGRIAQLGRLAKYHSLLEGRAEPRMQDVIAASWTAEGAGLEALAQPLPEAIPDEALVMTPVLREELNRLLLRCRGREGLVDGLGASASAKYRPGVRALFTGPSGTGKTLAAGWLATRLGLPLYRVDLAAVTSKYIGETEKNLAQLLARAEHSEVILLFDEADSMFGKRTDVKESNDRFANAQTNYLLQRIESFDGIVFLTSNSRARFDPAFFRRLDTIVEFPVPGPEERRMLWQSHLGADHSISNRELNQLSAAADLLGGHIRNAVLTAAVLARAENRVIAYGDILQALADEYRKLSRQVPTELSASHVRTGS